jgi:tetratricopeptide (TPR) repeat protein
MQPFDKLWDYSNPNETEKKFREVLAESSIEKDVSHYLQLLTQIARTFSLRAMFNEAHAVLDEVQNKLNHINDVANVRYHLERGRTFNSSGKKEEAKNHFLEAQKIAVDLKEDFYAIDCIHMLAIVAPPNEAIILNETAILAAEKSEQEHAKNWLGPLYNNLGWSYFDKGEHEKALSVFLRSLQWRESMKSAPEIFLAKWTVARTLRALNRIDDALKIQLALLEEMIETQQEDGYVYEELAELHLSKNETVSKMYFGFAYRELSKDNWLVKNEPARLERMKELSKD